MLTKFKKTLRAQLKSIPTLRNIARAYRSLSFSDLGWSKIQFDAAIKSNKKILIATGFGGEIAMTSVESLIAAGLKVRGADVHTLICDGISACQLCDTTRFASDYEFINRGFPNWVCAACARAGSNCYSSMDVKRHQYSENLEQNDVEIINLEIRRLDFRDIKEIKKYTFEGASLGEHVVAGVCRYFAKADISDELNYEKVMVKYFKAALSVYLSTDRLLKKEQFDCAVFNHGIYVPQGIIAEACKKNHVNIVNWNTAYRKQCFIFSHGDTYHHELMAEPTDNWESMPWDSNRSELIRDYINSRSEGQNDWIKFNDRSSQNSDDIKQELEINNQNPIIGLYTNVLWDAQLHYPANLFENMLEWLTETIEYFIMRTDLNLVIRVHPAELTGHLKSRQLVLDKIKEKYPELPKNVLIISSENKMNSYSLAKICDSVLIYGTKIGVELTSMGIPVIVAGEAWIRGKSISFDPQDRAEYFELLNTLPINKRLDPKVTERALKYAYHFFFRRMIPLKNILPTGSIPQYKLDLSEISNLKDFNCEGLDIICNGILDGTPFIFDGELNVR